MSKKILQQLNEEKSSLVETQGKHRSKFCNTLLNIFYISNISSFLLKELKRLENRQLNFRPFKCSDENCKKRFRRKTVALAHYQKFHEKVIICFETVEFIYLTFVFFILIFRIRSKFQEK